ncbi:IPT/TIG domain-containing protein, partial [Legionella brunensis]
MLKGTAHHSFVKIFSKVAKKKTQQFVSALLIYSQLLQVAAFAATPMQVNHMSSSSPWRNSTQSITPELSSPVTPLESLYLNNQQFGLNGPLTWGVNYSDLTGTFLNAQYLFPVNERLVFAALGEYGSGQYRYGGTVGYEFLPLSQVKFTAERFNQRLPFQFDSGAIEERVHQDAYGARFQQLFVHPFLQTVNAGGYYADASDKNLNPFVFASNGLNCSSQVGIECINYRHIAGATSKGIDAGVEVLLTPATLVGGNIYYDQVHYHTLFSDIFHENREGIGAAVKINHLFNSQFKFLGEASVRKIYDSYQGGIGWLPPLKDKRLEFALTGQHLVSHNSTPNNNSISLQVNWTPGSKEYEKRFNWRGKQLASVAQWVQMPAVHMNQVLAIAEQVTRYLAPAITAVTPNSGLFAGGNTITISGFNFIQGAQVFFGNQIAPLTTVQSSSLINVTVPPIASVASSLGVDIRVQNPDGQQATLPSGYTYGTPLLPKIAKVSLSKGNIYGDSTVVITGKNFTELTRVSFGGAAAKIVAQNKTELTVITPSHEAGVVDVVVATEKGSTTAKGVFTYVADAFQLPIIKKITANSGATTGGETVTISGSNFDENTSITFGGVAASIVSQNDAEVVVTVPSHDAGVVDVVVTTGKGSATAKESYTFVANSNSFNAKAPTIEKIIANSGATTGGETVTISGSNFDATTSVTFDSATAKIVSQNDKQVVITTPAHDAGVVDVIVTTENGSTKATNSYTYKIKKQANFAPPLIVNIFPTSGPTSGGQSVTIVGSNFVVGGSTVIFGASPATITSESSTVLVVTTPAGVGTVSVVVNTAEGSSNPASYSYDGPTIVGVSPSSGPTTGGQTVTITGNNFFPGAQSVTFGGIAAPIVSSTFNQIEVTTPPNSPGLTNIVVTTASGSSNNGSYTYVASPTLATVSPDSGPTAGGQTVTITGSNFVVGGTSVSFAG